MPKNPRDVWLGLALVLVLLTTWVSGGKDQDAGVVEPVNKAQREEMRKSAAATQEKPLRLGLEKLNRAGPPEEVADLFAAKSWYVPPPSAKPQASSAPTPPPLPFTYMGRLQEESGRVIIYLAQGDRAHAVSAGDVIEDTYRVETVEAQSVTLIYLPLKLKQTLQIGGDS